MPWKKPDDLELVAECESLPEAEIVIGLLATEKIESILVSTTDSTVLFSEKSVFKKLAKPRPHKILVHPEDAVTSQEILSATLEESGEDVS